MSFYERLSYLDNSFLALESHATHMHVAGLTIFATGDLQREGGGVDIDRIRAFVESKLHLIPRYRQRLAHVPIERAPVWVDDEHFSIDYHVRHTALPKPGTDEQLRKLMGRLASQQLDRRKPLWELWVVEGLEGDRFAIVSKIHHSMIDGMGSVELMAVLLNLQPVKEAEPAEPFRPREAPNGVELMVRETVRRTSKVLSSIGNFRSALEDAQSLALEGARRVRAMANSLSSGWLSMATNTPINGEVGPNRRFATLAMPLADVKEVKNALGGTVNDVVLATVAGGVRRYFMDTKSFDVDGIDFRVMAPVSVRSTSQRSAMGNHVAMWLAQLPVDEPDPAARLAAVSAETMKLKTTDQAYGAAALVRLSAGTPITLVSLASRLAASARPFNLTVTNVPGPQFPMYLLDAKMLEQYPLVPLWHGHGIGVALFSYDGTLFWGFNGDYDIMDEMDEFVTSIDRAFQELLELARSDDAVPLRQKAKRARRSAPKKRPPLGTKDEDDAETPQEIDDRMPKKRPPLGGKERVAVNGFTPSDESVTIKEFLANYRSLDDASQVSARDAEVVAAFMRAEYPRPDGVRGPWRLDTDQQRAAAAHLED
jgi:diacylglycerol O-acyltransferase